MTALEAAFEALDRQDPARADRILDALLAQEPGHVGALCLRADLLGRRGEFQAAFEHLARALKRAPDHAMPHLGMGQLFEKVRQSARAEPAFRRAAELAPDYFQCHRYLGDCLLRLGRDQEAAAALERALHLRPEFAPTLVSLGDAYRGLHRMEDARRSYEAALVADPALARGGLRVRLAMLVPPLAGPGECEPIRARYAEAIAQLDADPPALTDPVVEVGCTYFYLSYHGLGDRDLNAATARMFEKACPSLLFTAPHCGQPRQPGRLRIGFISQNFRNHSIGRSSRGVIARLDPARFEKTAYFFHEPADDLGRFIRDHAEHAVVLPLDLAAARRRIAEDRLDILYFQDIGMDPITYFLAYARLATLQCVRHGHPDTTGLRNMDWWISCEGFEPEGAEAHYSERLVKLRGIAAPTHYFRPEPPPVLTSRAELGLDPGTRLYFCPQTLFKFHPDFDPMLAAILRGDPGGRLALIASPHAALTRALQRRLLHTIPDVADRVDFLPSMPHAAFMGLLAAADVVLDTPHFCGMNTSLQAFSLGQPVVTLPGAFQRSRHTASMYRHMGLHACIASDPEDYVRIALRLGLDPEFRAGCQAEVRERSDRLYEDPQVLREFERVFMEAFPDAILG